MLPAKGIFAQTFCLKLWLVCTTCASVDTNTSFHGALTLMQMRKSMS